MGVRTDFENVQTGVTRALAEDKSYFVAVPRSRKPREASSFTRRNDKSEAANSYDDHLPLSNRADETGRIGSSGNRKRGSDRQSTSNHLLTVAMATRPRRSEYLYFSELGAQNIIIMLFAD